MAAAVMAMLQDITSIVHAESTVAQMKAEMGDDEYHRGFVAGLSYAQGLIAAAMKRNDVTIEPMTEEEEYQAYRISSSPGSR